MAVVVGVERDETRLRRSDGYMRVPGHGHDVSHGDVLAGGEASDADMGGEGAFAGRLRK